MRCVGIVLVEMRTRRRRRVKCQLLHWYEMFRGAELLDGFLNVVFVVFSFFPWILTSW